MGDGNFFFSVPVDFLAGAVFGVGREGLAGLVM
jgi:hypothetical protein